MIADSTIEFVVIQSLHFAVNIQWICCPSGSYILHFEMVQHFDLVPWEKNGTACSCSWL